MKARKLKPLDEAAAGQAIGANIRQWRKQSSLSQQEVANIMGVHLATISRYELGELPVTAVALIKFGRIFGCPPCELIDGVAA